MSGSSVCLSPYSVFGVDVCSAVNEMLSTLIVSCPHSYMERSAAQLEETNTERGFLDLCRKNTENATKTLKAQSLFLCTLCENIFLHWCCF